MDSKRQAKFSRQIQKDMSEIFQREGMRMFGKQFITVSQVRVTPDLGLVRIYLNILNDPHPHETVFMIRESTKELRTLLAQRIKDSIRKIPELEFYYDDTLDYAEKMDKIFKEINEKPKSGGFDPSEYNLDDNELK